jgi:serine/threonine-protein kinase
MVLRARDRLAELVTILGEPEPPEHEVYRAFGACRSGFRDALAVWSGNEAATRGLVDATVAVATYELALNHPQAAVSLLGELPEPHPLLETARQEAAKHSERIAELEHLGRDLDKRIGTRTRSALVLIFGLSFTILPIVIWEVPAFHDASHNLHIAWAFGMAGLIAIAARWARESVTATAYNRRIVYTFIFMFVIQALIAIGGAIADRPPTENYTWNLLLYTLICGTMTITIEPYLWPAVPIYMTAYLLALKFPDLPLPLSSLPNLTLTLLAAYRWKPDSIRYTPEERAARARVR